MADITIAFGTADNSKSVETAAITGVTLSSTAQKILKADECKNNSLHLIVNGQALTIKAGDNYPNKIMGDLVLTSEELTGTYNDVVIKDISRFENRDGSIAVAGTGTIYVVATRDGLDPTTKNIYNTTEKY